MAVAADCFDQLMTREEQLRRSKSWFSHNINISIRSASSAVREQFSAIGEKQFSPVFIRCCTVGESPRPAIFASKPDRSVDQSKQDLETRCVICQDTINQKLFLIARLPPVNIWILENSTKVFLHLVSFSAFLLVQYFSRLSHNDERVLSFNNECDQIRFQVLSSSLQKKTLGPGFARF